MTSKKELLIEKLPISFVFKNFNDIMKYDWQVSSIYCHSFVDVELKKPKSISEDFKRIIFTFIIPSHLMKTKKERGIDGYSYTIKNSISTFAPDFKKIVGNFQRNGRIYIYKAARKMGGIEVDIILYGIRDTKRNMRPEKLLELTEKTRVLIVDNLSSENPLRHKIINP